MSGATLRAGDGTGSRGAAPAGRPSRLSSPGGRGPARPGFTSASPEGPAAALRRAPEVALAPEQVPA